MSIMDVLELIGVMAIAAFAGVATRKFVVPRIQRVLVIYLLNGAEIMRETTTMHNLANTHKLGIEAFIDKARQQGMKLDNSVEPTEEVMPNNNRRLVFPVTYRGKSGVFTIEAYLPPSSYRGK